MHSFQPSRGRVLFEFLCALGVAASCVGAWMQTGATALLAAAGVASLYGLVHLFDMRRPRPAEAVEPQRVDFEARRAEIVVPMVAAEEQVAVASVAEAESVEPATPRAGSGRRLGGSRKGGGRRAKTPKAAEVVEPAPQQEADVPWPTAEAGQEARVPVSQALSGALEDEFASFGDEDDAQPHIAPLFEPEPFVRMPRQAFGRRGQI